LKKEPHCIWVLSTQIERKTQIIEGYDWKMDTCSDKIFLILNCILRYVFLRARDLKRKEWHNSYPESTQTEKEHKSQRVMTGKMEL